MCCDSIKRQDACYRDYLLNLNIRVRITFYLTSRSVFPLIFPMREPIYKKERATETISFAVTPSEKQLYLFAKTHAKDREVTQEAKRAFLKHLAEIVESMRESTR